MPERPLDDFDIDNIQERVDQARRARPDSGIVYDFDCLLAEVRVGRERETALRAENEKLRRAIDDIDRYTYGWSFGLVHTVIENIRVRARGVLND